MPDFGCAYTEAMAILNVPPGFERGKKARRHVLTLCTPWLFSERFVYTKRQPGFP